MRALSPGAIIENLSGKEFYAVIITCRAEKDLFYKRFNFYPIDQKNRLYFLLLEDITGFWPGKSVEAAPPRKAMSFSSEPANRSSFLSYMSHEIRTPITAILGMNELIRRESMDKNILDYVDNIEKAGISLLGVINDILDLSKLQEGIMELKEEPYFLTKAIGDAVGLVGFRAQEKGLYLESEVDPEIPARLFGDELRLKQVISLLLNIAVKYTEKGTVSFSCSLRSQEEDSVCMDITIKDTGKGIPPEVMELLLSDGEPPAPGSGHADLGLGLILCRSMLSLMGSTLDIESGKQGSVFSFCLRQGFISEEMAKEANPEAANEDDLYVVAPEAHILIVDDTPMNIQVLTGLLKRTLMKISIAENGEECIASFGDNDYDLVFLDYRMPGMDGIETLAKLHELYPEKAKDTPIVCLTADSVKGDREKMLTAGFTDYLAKPVNIKEMEKTLEKYLPEDKVGKGMDEPVEQRGMDDLPKEIFDIPFLTPSEGLKFCGDVEDYLFALRVFEHSIESKAMEIEQKLKAGDLAAYTILLHSLKSTSKAVGATSISEQALLLEQGGKAKDKKLLKKVTPEFLKNYRSMKNPLHQMLEAAGVRVPVQEDVHADPTTLR